MGTTQSSSAAKEAPVEQVEGSAPEKLGAGLLLTCGDEVLLLKRNSKHNHGTWGLPGGNADNTDTNLLHTATREAQEEMGSSLPQFEVLTEVLTKRGKRLQKHYRVYVARLKPEDRASWQPQLNEEHSDWRWFKLADAQTRADLHPVVAAALQVEPHRQAVVAAVMGHGQVAP